MIGFSVSLADPMQLVNGWERQMGAGRMGILLMEKRYGAVRESEGAGEEVRAKQPLRAGEMGDRVQNWYCHPGRILRKGQKYLV